MEEAAIMRDRSMSDYQRAIDSAEDWDRFAIAEIEKLETKQIQALAEWIYEDGVHELEGYTQSIFLVWGSRDPAAARAMLLEAAENNGLLDGKTDDASRNFTDELPDHFHHVRVGHARLDPAAAWREFLTDSADPVMNRLVNASVTIPQLFEIYAEKSPNDAWHQILTHPTGSSNMLRGFAKGAPPGQDWERAGGDYLSAMLASGENLSASDLRPLTNRWLTEDPRGALDWFAANIPPDRIPLDVTGILADVDSATASLGLSESSPRLRAEFELVKRFCITDNGPSVLRTLELLSDQGRQDLAVLGLRVSFGDSLRGYNLPFLDLIPGIEDPSLRTSLYLQAIGGIVVRQDDPFADPAVTDSLDVCIEAIRSLAAKLDLPREIREQADAQLQVVAEESRKIQEERAKHADEDPFAR
ncbi:hypothetical protein [Luteolibacter sp. Populi]|uniref:hypothetical protein n=1 Tax=Luteolibacter sp. Populi TaxID=3230487 RepID=UPI0034662547